MKVEVGKRYVLNLPSYNWGHPLRGLADQVRHFTQDGVEGKDPVNVLHVSTVEVLGIGYTVEMQPARLWGMEMPSRQVLKRPVAGVLVHLTRRRIPQLRVEVPIETVVQIGLDPGRRYFVQGVVWPDGLSLGGFLAVEDEEEDDTPEIELAYIIEEQDFVIPLRWLSSLADQDMSWRASWLHREIEEELGMETDLGGSI